MAKRVMIVDDSKSTRVMVAFTLRRAGYEVLEAETGHNALSAIENSRIDCLITDVNMPGMDGFELVRHLRQNASYGALPIIMLTTTVDTGSKEKARSLGATVWLGKPFLPAELIEIMSSVL